MRIPRAHSNIDFVDAAVEQRSVSKVKRKRSLTAKSPRRFDAAVVAAKECIADANRGTFDALNVKPEALVGLFIVFHTDVYGVEPAELLVARDFLGAVSAVRRLIRDEFDGRADVAMEFVRWTWMCEKRKFKVRTTEWRIGWRHQFCNLTLVTDYRIAMTKRVDQSVL